MKNLSTYEKIAKKKIIRFSLLDVLFGVLLAIELGFVFAYYTYETDNDVLWAAGFLVLPNDMFNTEAIYIIYFVLLVVIPLLLLLYLIRQVFFLIKCFNKASRYLFKELLVFFTIYMIEIITLVVFAIIIWNNRY